MAQESSEVVAWVVGEVLVDLIPSPDGDEKIDGNRYRAVVGGGAANTARALARLGKRNEFIGALSSDRFGHMAWMELERDGVGLDLIHESDAPTAKAILSLDEDGIASYLFEIDGSATFAFSPEWLPTKSPEFLHLGTLATVVAPGRDVLFQWVREKKSAGSFFLFDPNVRPAFLSDRVQYREVVEEWVALADLVKVSEEDLLWLYPESDPFDVISRWLSLAPILVVVTRGGEGMAGIRGDERVTVPGVAIELVDTVGAGDTVGAVLLEAVMENGIERLQGELLEQVLHRAALAAAITCSRQGAEPPLRNEVESRLELNGRSNHAIS